MTLSFLRWHSPKAGLAIIAALAGLEIAASSLPVSAQQALATAQTLYSQGDPTDDEQYLMQQLNRARMDPAGEGQRLAAWLRNDPEGQAVVTQYGTSPDQITSAFAMLPAVPPLAFDPDLLATARGHSQDMAAHDFLTHTGSDGSTPLQRVEASGYSGEYAGENAGGERTLDILHAAYLVDWGVPDLGHRKAEMTGVGAGYVVGLGVTIAADGMIWETEDYGGPFLSITADGQVVSPDVAAMLTGVVYNDANANGEYDPGEGIASVTVSMDGGKYYAVTSASGGYALPLVNADGSNADGTVPVRMTFADGGMFISTAVITRHEGNFGSYRVNVEWNARSADDQRLHDPNLPYFGGGKAVTVGAGGVIKLKVYRSPDSDLSQSYTVSYKATGSAVAGVNYVTLPTIIMVPAGQRKVKVEIATLDSGSGKSTTLRFRLPGVSYRGAKNVTITPKL